MHLLITRPEPDASEMRDMLRREGHTADISPLLDIELLPPPRDVFDGVAGLVVTSRNGLRAIASSPVLADLLQRPLFVVGSGTARSARDLGFKSVTLGPAAAKDLLPVIVDAWPRMAAERGLPLSGPLLHVSGDKLSFDLEPPLAEAGIELRRCIVYRSSVATRLSDAALAALAAGRYDAIVLMSPATAHSYLHIVEVNDLSAAAVQPTYLCLSKAIAACLSDLGNVRVAIAARPTIEETVALVRQLAAQSGAKSPTK